MSQIRDELWEEISRCIIHSRRDSTPDEVTRWILAIPQLKRVLELLERAEQDGYEVVVVDRNAELPTFEPGTIGYGVVFGLKKEGWTKKVME